MDKRYKKTWEVLHDSGNIWGFTWLWPHERFYMTLATWEVLHDSSHIRGSTWLWSHERFYMTLDKIFFRISAGHRVMCVTCDNRYILRIWVLDIVSECYANIRHYNRRVSRYSLKTNLHVPRIFAEQSPECSPKARMLNVITWRTLGELLWVWYIVLNPTHF